MSLRRLLFPFLFSSIVFAGFSSDDLARIWIDRAADLLNKTQLDQKELMEAGSALDIAEEFQAPGPDALYLRALIVKDGRVPVEGIPVRLAYDLSLAALDSDAVPSATVEISFRKRASLYAAIALRLKKYEDYLDEYASWPKGEKNAITILYAAARSALFLGYQKQAIALALRGESLSEETDSLAGLNLNLDHPLSAFRAIAVAAGDEKLTRTFASARKRWGQSLEDAIMPWILSGRVSGKTIRVILPSLSASAVKLANAVIGLEPLTDIQGDLALARMLEDSYPLEKMISSFTGMLTADTEYDGYEEERIKVVNGQPVYRVIDADQDGQYEWEFHFKDGIPEQIRLDGGRLEVHYDVKSYPEVHSINSTDGSTHGNAIFLPGSFTWDPGNGDHLSIQLDRPDWVDNDLWPFMSRISLQAELNDGRELGRIFIWLDKGIPVKSVEIHYSDSNQEEPLWVKELLYEDGIVTAGRRSLRKISETDSERLWELYERYENGEIVGLAWDPGMRGTPVYLKDWALETYLQIHVWNLNGDDWMDLRRFVSTETEDSVRELHITEAGESDLLPWSSDSWYPWE